MTEPSVNDKTKELVKQAIADALLVDPSELHGSTRLFADLDAESIDIVDIRFRIEKACGIKINQQDLFVAFGQDPNAKKVVEGFTIDYLAMFISELIA